MTVVDNGLEIVWLGAESILDRSCNVKLGSNVFCDCRVGSPTFDREMLPCYTKLAILDFVLLSLLLNRLDYSAISENSILLEIGRIRRTSLRQMPIFRLFLAFLVLFLAIEKDFAA